MYFKELLFCILGYFVGGNRLRITKIMNPCTCGGIVQVDSPDTCVVTADDPAFDSDKEERGSSIMVSRFLTDLEEQSL